MSEANKQVVRRFVEDVINRGRYDVLGEIYTPDMAAAARSWIAPFRDAFPDVHMRIVDLVGEGDRVAARFTCSATQRGAWQGHPAAGRRFEQVAEVTFFTIRDGRIAASWGLEDNLDRMAQLGLIAGVVSSAGGPPSPGDRPAGQRGPRCR